MMDMQLLGGEESTLGQTFEWTAAASAGQGQQQEGRGQGDVDVDLHLLKNLLESHSQGLGMPLGPASNLLAQFGLSLPTPPPMSSASNSKGGKMRAGGTK